MERQGNSFWTRLNTSCLSFSRKEVRELGLVILAEARKSLAAPALSRALAALQVSRRVLSWGSELLQAQGVSSRRLPPVNLETWGGA